MVPSQSSPAEGFIRVSAASVGQILSVRNAVGQQPVSHQDTLSGLKYFPLSKNLKAVPNVVGTYLLHGIRASCQDSAKDPRYVGQAASMSINQSGAVGVRRRGGQHLTSVTTCKCGLKSANGLRVHKRFAESDIAGIGIAVLSLFPFPVPQLGEDTLRHFLSILTLVEAIDIILLDTLGPLEDHEYRLRVGSKEALATLRPRDLPRRIHQGLNRAIPLIQGSNRMKGISYSACWSPSETSVFIRTVAQHENLGIHTGKMASPAFSSTSWCGSWASAECTKPWLKS